MHTRTALSAVGGGGFNKSPDNPSLIDSRHFHRKSAMIRMAQSRSSITPQATPLPVQYRGSFRCAHSFRPRPLL